LSCSFFSLAEFEVLQDPRSDIFLMHFHIPHAGLNIVLFGFFITLCLEMSQGD